MKKILGVVLGMVAAMAIVAAVDWIGQLLYPLDVELDMADRAALLALIAAMPLPAKLIVVASWICGAFGGAWLALRIADRPWAGWIVAGLVAVASIANVVMVPHPLWMQICALVLPLIGGWLASRLHSKPYPGEPLLG